MVSRTLIAASWNTQSHDNNFLHRGLGRAGLIFLPFNIDCVWEKFKFKISTDSEWLLNVLKKVN